MGPFTKKPAAPVAPAVPEAMLKPTPGSAVIAATTPKRSFHEVIAQVVHEANRVLTEHAGDVPVQVPWEQYPAEMRASAINGIEFLIKNPDAPPEQQHENWCAHKIAEGWTQNGIYSAESKTHPHLKAYGALAPEVRLKDKMFKAIVTTMLKLG